MPFVTEEIWSYMPGERDLLAASPWPAADPDLLDEEAEEVVGEAIEAVTELRRYRDEAGVPAGATLRARVSGIAAARRTTSRASRGSSSSTDGDEEPVTTDRCDRDPCLRRHLGR